MGTSRGAVTGLKILKGVVWVVYALATAAVVIMAFGFFLLLFGASVEAGFAQFIYKWGLIFSAPFQGMIEPVQLENGGVISWSALIAMAAYAVLAGLIGSVLNSISRRIYRDTRSTKVGEQTVITTQQQAGGETVTTQTTMPVIQPSAVEQEEARRQAEAAERAAAEQAAQE
jgi:hypothetical protein